MPSSQCPRQSKIVMMSDANDAITTAGFVLLFAFNDRTR